MTGPAQNQDHPRLARARAAAEAAAEAAAAAPQAAAADPAEGVTRGEATAIIRGELEAAVAAAEAERRARLDAVAAGVAELREELEAVREELTNLWAHVGQLAAPPDADIPPLTDPAEDRTGHDVAGGDAEA